MLYEFLNSNREELVSRCKAKVDQRHILHETPGEINYGIPIFLTQLVEILRKENSGITSSGSAMEIARTAGSHGNELLRRGFTAGQIVHNYGDLCQAVTELAIEQDARITLSLIHISEPTRLLSIS